MSSVTSSGGGGPIYQDGDPVSVTLQSGESVTVPAGETWVVTITTGYRAKINGAYMLSKSDNNPSTSTVLTGGDNVSDDGNNGRIHVGGWSV